MLVSSHVLDEVERLGSRILVMSQGRLAAAGDFHELRALWTTARLRVRVRTNRPRELAGALLEAGTVVGARLEGDESLELDTNDARALARALAPVARERTRACSRSPPRRRSRGRLPLPGAAMSAPAAPPAAAPSATLVALYRLVLRTQVTVPRLLGIGALGAWPCCSASSRPGRRSGRRPRRTSCGLRPRHRRAARGAVARDGGDRRPRRGPPARLPLAEAGRALAAPGRGRARHRHARRAARRGAARGPRARRGRRRGRARVLRRRSLAALAYAGLFVAAGLWFRRAVWWGLAFFLLWENAAAHASDGTARFTVTSWARSIVSTVDGVDVRSTAARRPPRSSSSRRSRSPAGSSATVRYRRADID